MNRELAAALLMEKLIRSSYTERRSSAVQPLQWSILRYLSDLDGPAPDVSTVAQYVGVTPAPASRAISTLEKRGLVAKQVGVENPRAVAVSITPEGLEYMQDDPLRRLAEKLATLPEEKREPLILSIRSLALQN